MSRTQTRLRSLIVLLAIWIPAIGLAQDPALLQPHQQFEAAKNRGDMVAAVAYAEQVLALARDAYGNGSVELLDALEILAGALAGNGDLQGAIEINKRALAIQERASGADHPDLVPTLQSLADLGLQSNDIDLAAAYLERILAIESATYGPAHDNSKITRARLRDLYASNDRGEDLARIEREIADADIQLRSLDDRRYETEDGFATVRVFYGTNRARTGEDKASEFYGGERGDLELGFLDVSIPAVHKYGELETSSRWSLMSYMLGEDALKRKYVLLLKVKPLESDSFHEQLREYIVNAPADDVFVFVHGYNSSFEDAARRTAQLAYDLDFDGTPMLYSWPSRASTTAYTVDEASVRVSSRKMAGFLEEVVSRSGAGRVHLIAHSMGNRAMIEALETIAARRDPALSPRMFDEVVFTAPDVDREYFVDIINNLRDTVGRITLYASENDVALRTSAILHGAPRAGLAGEAVVAMAGVDTIDMSAVEADRLGHSYFAANEGAIYDLFRLLWRGDPPERRCGLQEGRQEDIDLWMFDVELCRGDAVLQAGLLFKRFGAEARDKIERRLNELDADAIEDREEWTQILSRLEILLKSGEE